MKTIHYKNREAWLADRPNHIGASESPGILGHGYSNESRLATYAKKIGLDEVIDETDRQRMDIGTLQEPVIREIFQQETGLQVDYDVDLTVRVSDEHPYLSCTLDGQVMDSDGPAVWEAKNVGEYMAFEWEEGLLPMRVQIQTQHQMLVTGYPRAYIAALIGGNRLVWKMVERNDHFISSMLPSLDAFWRAVQNRTPPAADGSAATSAALKRLYGKEDGETIELPPEATGWDENLQSIKAEIKGLEAIRRDLENQIKAEMKDAAFGSLPRGGRYAWLNRERHEEAREARVITYREFRRRKK